MPLILESAESHNAVEASTHNAAFVDKNSKKMAVDLRRAVKQHFGFGDFVFRDPRTFEEVARARNLKEMQNAILTVPADSLLYHITRNPRFALAPQPCAFSCRRVCETALVGRIARPRCPSAHHLEASCSIG